jgi:inorganic pyrophosphatase
MYTLRQTGEFWDYLDRLVAGSQVTIDRPCGSHHPVYSELIYPLDYGYLVGTTTVDGGGIDVWAGSLPGRRLDAVVMTVDLHKRDAEIKLLLGCTEAEKQVILDFLNGSSMRAWLVRRGDER